MINLSSLMFFFKKKAKITYTSKDKDVVEALAKNGDLTKAPKGSYGCSHCALSDMQKLYEFDFKYYTAQGRLLHGKKCANRDCQHGIMGKKWPINNIVGDKIQGYWCKFASKGLCGTFIV